MDLWDRVAQRTSLAPREIEILKYVSEGLKNIEIAQKLGISISTVASYMRRIFLKLDVKNRTAAVAVASRAGMAESGDGSTVDDRDGSEHDETAHYQHTEDPYAPPSH